MKYFLGILALAICLHSNAQTGTYEKVEMLLKSKKYTEAMGALDSIGKSGNNSGTAIFQFYRAGCLALLDRKEEAIKICSDEIIKASKADTVLHRFYALRCSIYKDLGKLDSAIQDITKAIEFKPSEIHYYLNASFLYGETGNYDKSLMFLEKALKLSPYDVFILNNISYYSALAKQYEKAIIYANEGLKYTHDSTWVGTLLNNRGFAYLGLKKYEMALSDIDESIKYYSENSYAYYNKALVFIQKEEFTKACENLNMAKQYGGINMTQDLLKSYCEKH